MNPTAESRQCPRFTKHIMMVPFPLCLPSTTVRFSCSARVYTWLCTHLAVCFIVVSSEARLKPCTYTCASTYLSVYAHIWVTSGTTTFAGDNSGPTADYILKSTELLKHHQLVPARKFVESFANQTIVFSIYLENCDHEKVKHSDRCW